ncbi:MAG: anion permease [Niabella sp.]
MEFIVFVIVLLFVLAIADLIVGVSNDAVNFLNSAIGSKVASYKYIILIAMGGIVLGAVFSSGIMEIARKGIFHPELFTFDKILIVFLAVMLTDIVLLDIFNTLGLPTSTTVSIVFELLGAALVTGFLFSYDQNHPISQAFSYINMASTSNIISGIFLSILIAFTAGVVIQYLCRMIFTFQYVKRLNAFGALFSGFGLTAIVYFLLIKGLKGTSIINDATRSFVTTHTLLILVGIFIVTTLVCFILQKTIRLNPLRVVVLAGTFSLAMAFAGNDLVNFIGVPITGFIAFENWRASGVPANELYQTYLAGNDIVVPNYMLIIAGIIMAFTIWLSAKAKKVTETEVSLGRQDEGEERFKPNLVSRSIVNSAIIMGNIFKVIIPKSVIKRYDQSFRISKLRLATNVQEQPAFDLVRASSNLVIASIIIAWATSMKLPLSTTYVSFMVAMGSSLADKAWGRESAVYRVAGVLSVIGGWFVTALIAFTVAGLFAFILYKGGKPGAIILMVVVLLYIISSHINFSKKQKKIASQKSKLQILDKSDSDLVEANRGLVVQVLLEVAQNYHDVLEGLGKRDIAKLQAAHKGLDELSQYSYKLRSKNIKYIKGLNTNDQKVAELMLYTSDLVQDLVQSTKTLSHEGLYYLKNLHELSDDGFLKDIDSIAKGMSRLFSDVVENIKAPSFDGMEQTKESRNEIRELINEKLSSQVATINKEKISTRQGMLSTGVYLQSRDIQAVLMRIAKLYRKYDKRIPQTAES